MTITPLDGPRVPAASGKAEQLVILSHGYGADGQDLIGLAPHWQRYLPTAAFVAPNAPERCEMQPMGYQWFPITGLNPAALLAGVESAAPALDAFIDQELDRHGLTDSQLALVGFSQGTMMSLHVGLRREKSPACIIGYSGTLAGPELLKQEMTVKPPVLLVHGDADEMIPAQATIMAAQALGDAGLSAQWHVVPGLGHGIDPSGLDLGGRFLAEAFAGRLGAAGG